VLASFYLLKEAILMEFQTPAQFIGDMPDQYRLSAKTLRRLIAAAEKRANSDDPEAVAKAGHDLPLLREMLDDMTRATRTVEGYYTGGNCDRSYTCVRALKATHHMAREYTDWIGGDATDNSEYVRGLRRELRDCIRTRLTERQRRALILCEYKGMTQEQVAAKLGVGQPRIHKRIEAAKRKIAKNLRAAVENRGYFGPSEPLV
jgi:RNA polymerase sigma factor (sigma-70 family)